MAGTPTIKAGGRLCPVCRKQSVRAVEDLCDDCSASLIARIRERGVFPCSACGAWTPLNSPRVQGRSVTAGLCWVCARLHNSVARETSMREVQEAAPNG